LPEPAPETALQRAYALDAWVDDGRPMRAVTEERLLKVTQVRSWMGACGAAHPDARHGGALKERKKYLRPLPGVR
jgi:hypothetical protein